jgi:hypothetical protein
MREKTKIVILRSNFLFGAIVDAFYVFPLLIPKFGLMMMGITNFEITFEFQYVMGIAAALDIGWTVLLIWAFMKPIERRGVAFITVFAVKLMVDAFGVIAVVHGTVTAQSQIFGWSLSLFGYAFVAFALIVTRDLAKKSKEAAGRRLTDG